MAGLINWGTGQSNQPSSGRIDWGGVHSNVNDQEKQLAAQNAQIQQSRQQEQQQIKPAIKQNFFQKLLGGFKSSVAPPQPTDNPIIKGLKTVDNFAASAFQPVINGAKSTVNVAKAGVDLATGNTQGAKNAVNAAKQNVNDTVDIARQFTTRPAVQLATSLEPKQVTTTPTNPVSRLLLGSTPVQNIEKGVVSTYQNHPNLPGVARVGLAGAYGAGQLANDLPLVGAAGKGVKTAVSDAKSVFGGGAKAFLDTAKEQHVLRTAQEANTPHPIAVTDHTAPPADITVKTPTHLPITTVKTADKVTVRTPVPVSDQQFTKEFNGLSKAYDKETGLLQKTAAVRPAAEVKSLSDALETKYQGKLNDLVDRYHNPPLSEPVAPKPLRVAQDKMATPKPVQAVESSPAIVDTATADKMAQTAPTKLTEPTVAPAESVKVPRDQLPVGTGADRISRLSARMQGTLNNLSEEDKAALPTYKKMNQQENIQAAAMFVDKHPDQAMKVLRGEMDAPQGVAHNSIYLAMSAKGSENPELARNLASLASTRHGQEISLLRNANPNDLVSHITELRNAKIEGKGGETKIAPKRTAIAKEIQTNIPKVTKDSWSSFVESLRC